MQKTLCDSCLPSSLAGRVAAAEAIKWQKLSQIAHLCQQPVHRPRVDRAETGFYPFRSAAPGKLADIVLRAQEMGNEVALFRWLEPGKASIMAAM
jgi:hypothetical protein